MKARRGATLGLAVASAAALAVAVPFATADKGGKKHPKPGTGPVAGAPAPQTTTAGPRGILEASLNASKSGKSQHDKGKNRGRSAKPAGIATISVNGTKLCYAIVTTGVDALVKGELISRKGGATLVNLPTGANPLAGDPAAVANCITIGTGQYDVSPLDVKKLLRKPEKFVVKVTTLSGAISGKLHKVSRHS